MLPSKVHILKSHGNYVSANVNSQRFIIGFFKENQLKLVKHNIDITRDIRVIMTNPENVASEVNKGLKEFGVDVIIPDLMIDTDATLHIPITKKREIFPSFTVSTIDTQDFMMWPFEKYLGIVFSSEIEYREDQKENEWIYSCQVIHPSQDIERFRKSLKLN